MQIKLITLLLFIGCIQVSARGYGQQVTIKVNDASITEVFQSIRKQTGYLFVYDLQMIQEANKVSLNVKNMPVDEVLAECFKDQPLTYSIVDNTIIIRQKAASSEKMVADTSVVVRGHVSDLESGSPLAGVTIALSNTSIGTVTNEEGYYSITVPNGKGKLVFSYVGYKKKEEGINGRSEIDVLMETSISSLDRLVVIGYGIQKEKDVTGAVSSADLTRAQDLPNTNIMETLQGTLPGINVVPNGRPGTAGTITIRGQRSISASNDPLIVLDGVIFAGTLADINPADVASVDILKDVSSSAIYGSRGANGVILITTKRGTAEKPVINFSIFYGRSDYARKLPLLDRKGYLQKVIDYQYELVADGLPAQGPEPIDPSNPGAYLQNPSEQVGYAKGTNTDWLSVIKQPAPQVTYNLSVAGKSDHANYFLSGNYTDQRGIMLGDQFKRHSFRANLESSITSWLKIGTNSFFERTNQSGIPSTFSGQLAFVSPLVEPRDSAGNVIKFPMDDQGFINPIENSLGQNRNISSTLEGTMYAIVDIPYIKGLSYRVNWSNTFYNSKNYTFWTPDTYHGGFGLNGSGSRALRNSLDTWLDNIVTYKKVYKKHTFDVTLLYSYNKHHSEASSMSASNFTNTALGYNGLSLGGTQSVGQSSSSYVNIGSMARLNYAYAGRYLITGTARRDGYSAFGGDKKFGVFPSFALAWITSEENFLKEIRWIDFLKFRYSYGASGNQGISPYSSLAHIGLNGYVFGDVGSQTIGQYVSSLANTTLGWETTLGSNYGIDLNILKSRIQLTADYYHYHTKNLLLMRAIPSTTGFSSVLGNIGATANQGLEIALNTVNIATGNLKWVMNFNISMNRNKITHLYGTIDPATGKELDDIANRWFIGHPIGTIYDYVFDGIYQEGEKALPGNAGLPGYVKVKDVDSDGKIDANDRMIIGTTNPQYRAGLNNTFEYKGFAFSFFINTVHGGIYNNLNLDPDYHFAYRGNYLDIGWWTPSNKSDTRPSLNYSNLVGIGFYQSRSVIRVQDISLSYSFPEKWLEGVKMNSLRIYMSAKNPFMFTKWTGYDPELGNSAYPNYKTLAVGLNLSF